MASILGKRKNATRKTTTRRIGIFEMLQWQKLLNACEEVSEKHPDAWYNFMDLGMQVLASKENGEWQNLIKTAEDAVKELKLNWDFKRNKALRDGSILYRVQCASELHETVTEIWKEHGKHVSEAVAVLREHAWDTDVDGLVMDCLACMETVITGINKMVR